MLILSHTNGLPLIYKCGGYLYFVEDGESVGEEEQAGRQQDADADPERLKQSHGCEHLSWNQAELF